MLNKKGAMFGLDARIALAIFGALSVISGAALYSAIQAAKNEAKVQTGLELYKGIEQYMLDKGELFATGNVTYTDVGLIAKNFDSDPLWNGPYYGESTSTRIYIKLAGFTGNTAIDENFQLGKWGKDVVAPSYESCFVASTCYFYLFRSYSDTNSNYESLKSTALSLDAYVDGGDGGSAGKVRYAQSSGTYTFAYRIGLAFK